MKTRMIGAAVVAALLMLCSSAFAESEGDSVTVSVANYRTWPRNSQEAFVYGFMSGVAVFLVGCQDYTGIEMMAYLGYTAPPDAKLHVASLRFLVDRGCGLVTYSDIQNRGR